MIRRGRRRTTRQLLTLSAMALIATTASPAHARSTSVVGAEPGGVIRQPWAFTADSFWNRPHDDTSAFPTDPKSDTYLQHLKEAVPQDTKYVELAGADNDAWGVPYYSAAVGGDLVSVTGEQDDPSNCYGFPVP